LQASELDAIDAEVLELIDRVVKVAKTAAPPSDAEITTDVYISY
jgi:hypothetical protein